MPSLMHTVFYFVVALAILIAFHEFGHFIAARRMGVKVLRFSIGFGKSLWRYQKTPSSTEFNLSVIPLGGYVKMVDETEGEVAPADLPYAFNRQSLIKRAVIVAAGPVFNFLLAVLLYWSVFMIGETGLRPLLGPVAEATLAQQAGFREGDEILAVDDVTTPTWMLAVTAMLEKIIDNDSVAVTVRTADGAEATRVLTVPHGLAEQPERLHDQLGLQPWQPSLEPVIERIEPNSAAEAAGLQPGDRLVSADGQPIKDWKQWVDIVRAHPEQKLQLQLERGGVRTEITIVPRAVASPQGNSGHIGAAVRVPAGQMEAMTVEYRLGAGPALLAALGRTADYSAMTLRMIGRMVIGRASVENLSGPISIAQYAGQSARLGLTQFLKFLAIVSVSLAVLNLLPIPVLDGGHLMFYLIEAVKGSPVSEQVQAFCQQAGLFLLLSLMALAFVLDINRLFS